MTIHIGQIIKKTLKTKDMSVGEFAESISYTRGNAYKVFNKQTIDTGLLLKINKVLGENLFFKFIAESELDKKTEERMKAKLALKAWDEFMTKVKSTESEKAKKSPMKSKSVKKPIKK